MNLFATVLTFPAPSANYRGESELNRTVIQKITDGRFEYPIVSPEAMRNALRELLGGPRYKLPMNRIRLPDEKQLAVQFNAYPNPSRYADDFLFGYLVTADDRRKFKRDVIRRSEEPGVKEVAGKLQKLEEKIVLFKQELEASKKRSKDAESKERGKGPGDGGDQGPVDAEDATPANTRGKKAKSPDIDRIEAEIKVVDDEINALIDGFHGFRFKRDSILRMNLAKGLEPYRHNAVFTQSPLTIPSVSAPLFQNAGSSALLHRETTDTAFQYPFALNCDNCLYDYLDENGKRPESEDGKPKQHPYGATWARSLLKAIGELSDAAGNHARSLYFMAPASIVIRLTEQLCPGHEQYHFTVRRDPATNRPIYESKVITMLLAKEPFLPGKEFYIGGEIAETLREEYDSGITFPEKKKDGESERGKTRFEILLERGVTLDPDPRRLLATSFQEKMY
jgi:hypothetical protein